MTKNYKLQRSKEGKDGLASKVLKIPKDLFRKDLEGEYLPYCDFSYHRGIIIDEYVCKSRDCKYYQKLYI